MLCEYMFSVILKQNLNQIVVKTLLENWVKRDFLAEQIKHWSENIKLWWCLTELTKVSLFIEQVKVNGVEYKPTVGSPSKKQARAEAAAMCLKALGVLPSN